MRAAIISTGNELLSGAIADTNAAWISSRMARLGTNVEEIAVVSDDVRAIAEAIDRFAGVYDLVIVGGGLGPTEDDLTAQAAAEAAGVELVHDETAADQVRARFDRIGYQMHEINLKQALLPAGSSILENPAGTAPGFELTLKSTRFAFFPGVPRELREMFELHVPGMIPEGAAPAAEAVFKCFGRGESNLQASIAHVTRTFAGTRLAFRASFPEITVTLSAEDAEVLSRAEREVGDALGAAVFARERIGLPEALGKALATRGLTVGTAESCTGGLIAHSLTEVPGSSRYFKGAIVCYDNEVKTSAASVDPELIEKHGAVSEEVANAMATGARRTLGVDVAMATSGIAGPSGGTDDKPVGLVHMAVAHRGGIAHRRAVFKGYARSRVKVASAWTAMRMALDAVLEMR